MKFIPTFKIALALVAATGGLLAAPQGFAPQGGRTV